MAVGATVTVAKDSTYAAIDSTNPNLRYGLLVQAIAHDKELLYGVVGI